MFLTSPPSMFDVGSPGAWPPQNESITLNNVNVSPSQHKTNNHCSLSALRAASVQPPQPPGTSPGFFFARVSLSSLRSRRRGIKNLALASKYLQLELCFRRGKQLSFFFNTIYISI